MAAPTTEELLALTAGGEDGQEVQAVFQQLRLAAAKLTRKRDELAFLASQLQQQGEQYQGRVAVALGLVRDLLGAGATVAPGDERASLRPGLQRAAAPGTASPLAVAQVLRDFHAAFSPGRVPSKSPRSQADAAWGQAQGHARASIAPEPAAAPRAALPTRGDDRPPVGTGHAGPRVSAGRGLTPAEPRPSTAIGKSSTRRRGGVSVSVGVDVRRHSHGTQAAEFSSLHQAVTMIQAAQRDGQPGGGPAPGVAALQRFLMAERERERKRQAADADARLMALTKAARGDAHGREAAASRAHHPAGATSLPGHLGTVGSVSLGSGGDWATGGGRTAARAQDPSLRVDTSGQARAKPNGQRRSVGGSGATAAASMSPPWMVITPDREIETAATGRPHASSDAAAAYDTGFAGLLSPEAGLGLGTAAGLAFGAGTLDADVAFFLQASRRRP
jgi:hypothetical protein